MPSFLSVSLMASSTCSGWWWISNSLEVMKSSDRSMPEARIPSPTSPSFWYPQAQLRVSYAASREKGSTNSMCLYPACVVSTCSDDKTPCSLTRIAASTALATSPGLLVSCAPLARSRR